MSLPVRLLASFGLAVAISGCATLGTNVEGDFTCRAPKGDCAPSAVIDGRATKQMTASGLLKDGLRHPVPVAAGDQDRTSERTLRIVFPARVDETGTLHDDAVAWAVVESPRWTAELRRKTGEAASPPLMRQLRRQLQAAQAASEVGESASAIPGSDGPQSTTLDLGQPFLPVLPSPEEFSSASPLALPSTAREAVAGAKAPVVEGFDMHPPQHDRAPRPSAATPLVFPSSEAIEAARSPAHPESEPK